MRLIFLTAPVPVGFLPAVHVSMAWAKVPRGDTISRTRNVYISGSWVNWTFCGYLVVLSSLQCNSRGMAGCSARAKYCRPLDSWMQTYIIPYNLNPFFICRSFAMTSTGSVLPVALCTSGSYLRQQPAILSPNRPLGGKLTSSIINTLCFYAQAPLASFSNNAGSRCKTASSSPSRPQS